MKKTVFFVAVILLFTCKAFAFSGAWGTGGSANISDDAYGSGWNGDTTDGASKNALYDKIETLGGGFDPTGVDSVTWSDGSNASNTWTFDVSGTNTTMIPGNGIVTFSHDVTVAATGTMANTVTNSIDGTGAVDLDYGSADITDHTFISDGGTVILDGAAYILEKAEAGADAAGYGQIWVNTATPNELWFTDDAGTDVQLGTSGSTAWSSIGDSVANNEIGLSTYTNELVLGASGSLQIGDGAGTNYIQFLNDSGTIKMSLSGNAVLNTGTITLADEAIFGQTGTSAGDMFHFAAYDSDGTAYEKLITLTNANDPSVKVGSTTNNMEVSKSGTVAFNGAFALPAGSVDAGQLVSTAVTPGSYTFTALTVDADGRITAASSGSPGAETNSLETTITGIADTEIFVGDGADSGAFVAMSGDATMANTGALAIANDAIETAMINTDAVTMDGIDTDGNFTSLTGNWSTTGIIKGRLEIGTDITGATSHDTAELHNTLYMASAAATVTLDAAADAGFGSVVTYWVRDAAEALILDPQAGEKMRLDGVAGAAGEYVTGTGVDSIITLVAVTDTDGSGTDGYLVTSHVNFTAE